MDLADLLHIVKLTNRFQQTKRSIFAVGEDRMENDAEHSYQLALIAWYINNIHKIGLNNELLLKYSLVHDLVEAYAGDTPNFGENSEELQKTKHSREEQALTQLKKDFPSFSEMNILIEQYEKRIDGESKFIYVLDKFLGPVNIYLDGGRSFYKNNVNLEMVIAGKESKIIQDPIIHNYFKELVVLMKEKEKELFPKTL